MRDHIISIRHNQGREKGKNKGQFGWIAERMGRGFAILLMIYDGRGR